MFVISSNNSFPTAILDGLKSIGLRPISESPFVLDSFGETALHPVSPVTLWGIAKRKQTRLLDLSAPKILTLPIFSLEDR